MGTERLNKAGVLSRLAKTKKALDNIIKGREQIARLIQPALNDDETPEATRKYAAAYCAYLRKLKDTNAALKDAEAEMRANNAEKQSFLQNVVEVIDKLDKQFALFTPDGHIRTTFGETTAAHGEIPVTAIRLSNIRSENDIDKQTKEIFKMEQEIKDVKENIRKTAGWEEVSTSAATLKVKTRKSTGAPNVTGVLRKDEKGNTIFRFTAEDGTPLGDIPAADVFAAVSKSGEALDALVAERFNLPNVKAEAQVMPVVALNNIIEQKGKLKKDSDTYGKIKRGLKRNTRRKKKEAAETTAAETTAAETTAAETTAAETADGGINFAPALLSQYEILTMLEIITRKPKMDEGTTAAIVKKKREGSTIEISKEDFGELATRIYGRNEKKQRRAVFDRLRALVNMEFDVEVPKYSAGKDRKICGTTTFCGPIITYAYEKEKEQDDGDAHKMYISYTELFYYMEKHLYTNIDLGALEQAAREKGGGLVLRAALYAATKQPYKTMHFKHGGDKYTLQIPYNAFFDGYKEKTRRKQYDDRENFTPSVTGKIKYITGCENVEKTDSGISITFSRNDEKPPQK